MRRSFLFVIWWLSALWAIAATAFGQAPLSITKELPVVQPHRRALIIGAAGYRHLSPLKYPTADAARFRKSLLESYRFTADSTQLISDVPDADGAPTSKGIRSALEKLLSDPTLRKGDLFILYFSGHGLSTPKGDFLCPVDAKREDIESTGIPVQEVVGQFVAAGLRNVMIVADACRDGEKNEFGSELIELGRKTNIAILLGCAPGQRSYEEPKFGSGVFTHYLVRAMENPSLRSATGSLWASRVAESVAKSAFGYTLAEYGAAAQRPTSWTDETKDVLLGAFPSQIGAKFDIRGLQSEVANDPKRYADVLMEHALALSASNAHESAIPLLKVIESVDPTNAGAKFLLACTLFSSGRYGEAERLYRDLRGSGDGLYAPLAILWTPSRSVTPAERVAAAKELLTNSGVSPDTALSAWASVRSFGGAVEVVALSTRIAPLLDEGSALRLVLESDIAIGTGDFEMALARLKSASAVATNQGISAFLIRTLQTKLLYDLERFSELELLLKEPEAAGGVQADQFAQTAYYLAKIGNRQEAQKMALKAVNTPGLRGDAACLCIEIMGIQCGKLGESLASRLKESPYDWRLRYAALLSEGMRQGKEELVTAAFSEVQKYCDDELNLLLQVYELNDAIFVDLIENSDADSGVRSDFDNAIFHQWVGMIDRFGTSETLWNKFAITALRVGEGPRALELMQTQTANFAEGGGLGNLFYQSRYLLANSAGNEELMRDSAFAKGVLEPDRTDMKWAFAAHLAMLGKFSEAEKLAEGLKNGSFMIQPTRQFCLAALRYSRGDTKALDAVLADTGDREVHAVAKQMAAAILARDGKAKQVETILAGARPIGKLTNVAASIQCVKAYAELLRKEQRNLELDQLVLQSAQAHLGNPVLAGLEFSHPAEVTPKSELVWIGEDPYDPTKHTHQLNSMGGGTGNLSLKRMEGGIVAGVLVFVGGESWELAGKIDSIGNLRLEAKSKTGTGFLLAKLIPADFLARVKSPQIYALRLLNGKQILLVTKAPGA